MAPSVSHDQRLPVNLSRSLFSPDRSIDRSYRIDVSLSFSLFRSLSQIFQSTIQYESFARSFSTFLPALSLAQTLSIGQQEICVRHDRILQLSFVLFCFCAFGYSLARGNRTQHNGRIVRPPDFPSSAFVCDSFTQFVRRPSRCFERVHPFNFVYFASGNAPPARIPPLLLFNETDLGRGRRY